MKKYETPVSSSIKFWAEEDRPREKLVHHGKSALNNAELLAIILSNGSKDETAVGLSQRILDSCNNNLSVLAQISIKDLTLFKGIGMVKAISILAALELGTRRQQYDVPDKPFIRDSHSAYEYLKRYYQDLDHEQSWVLYLNQARGILNAQRISQGGITATIVDPRIIFKKALESGATSCIISHNHPSGNTQPSTSDIELTKNLVFIGQKMQIPLADHLIISEKSYYSFADEGML